MIQNLHVRGIGGIKEAFLEFGGEFIVITGESGAGKSSLVRALEFISGKRAQVNYIHVHEDFSEVIVNLTDKANKEEHSVSRRFGKDSKSAVLIDKHAATVSKLSEFMEHEIVIQSQYAQLALLEPLRQLELVDSCGGAELLNVKRQLSEVFEQTLAAEKELSLLKNKRKEQSEKFSDAEKDIALINSMKLTPDSEQKFEAELKELNEQSGKLKNILKIYNKISGEQSDTGLLDEVSDICSDIRTLDDAGSEKTETAEQLLNVTQKLLSLFEADVKTVLNAGSVEEARDAAEEKLGRLRKLKRKLKLDDCTALLNYAAEAQQAVVWLQTSLSQLKELETTTAELRKKVVALVQQLRTLRKKAAQKLEEMVNISLEDLAMGYAKFEIAVTELDCVRANGAESVQFMLHLPDQTPMPVNKTASGGELSRILIALQLAASDEKLPGTLVFDEVEAGLGGKSALLAGYKLKELSKRCRTILITHEATIAAMADTHFVVRRTGDETFIEQIGGNTRKKEIARMLSGDENSPEALKHAESLLKNKDCRQQSLQF